MKPVIALCGNPNVGKSTVFNALTGLSQHTGNWAGKTIELARGYCKMAGGFEVVDLPGCHALTANSEEEAVALNFISSGEADAIVVICDTTCIERGMRLALQVMEITPQVVICANLADEADKNHITVDTSALSSRLGVPVIPTSARNGAGLEALAAAVIQTVNGKFSPKMQVTYPIYIEQEISRLLEVRAAISRPYALAMMRGHKAHSSFRLREDDLTTAVHYAARALCEGLVKFEDAAYRDTDMKIDRYMTGRRTAVPIMLLALLGILWLTISGANAPSAVLSRVFFWFEPVLEAFLRVLHIPRVINEALTYGVYRSLSWVVSVMLPPMAIFFPLFTLLEDAGFLPRVAFNLDGALKKCGACGNQALTMCLGFGCNAAGVTGCRIIGSARERLIAIITNNFMPCNGRFPTLIALSAIFFFGAVSPLSALVVLAAILTGVGATFGVSKLLALTVLRGEPSQFILEMPPYRKPQIGGVIIRSIIDRTLRVLLRAVCVAAPAGLFIWIMANTYLGYESTLLVCATALNPIGRLLGMDGTILLAFILGFPANEIVIPIMIMAYTAGGRLADLTSITALKELFVSNGWSWVTALCVMVFSLMHWPCSTACLTIMKETKSRFMTMLAIVIPTVCGVLACIIISAVARVFS